MVDVILSQRAVAVAPRYPGSAPVIDAVFRKFPLPSESIFVIGSSAPAQALTHLAHLRGPVSPSFQE